MRMLLQAEPLFNVKHRNEILQQILKGEIMYIRSQRRATCATKIIQFLIQHYFLHIYLSILIMR